MVNLGRFIGLLLTCLAMRYAQAQDLPDLPLVSRALQEGATTFLKSQEAQQAAQAVQDAAKHFQETTQSMLSTPQGQKVATSIESAASAVRDGTTSFLQSGQVAETATAVGNAAGTMLAAGAKATTAGSQALQRAVGALVDGLSVGVAPSTGLTEGEDASVIAAPSLPSRAQKFAGAPLAEQDDDNDLVAAAPTEEQDEEAVQDLEPIGTRSAMLGDDGSLLPKQGAGMRSLAATRSSGGSSAGIDGIQLLQGLQAVVSTAAQVAQAARANQPAPGAPIGSPLGAFDAMAQTALNSPLLNGQSAQGQAIVVLPQAPMESLPPGVDAQSAQRVRIAAQGAINSLTISKSPNQQSILAQLSNAVQQQKSPEEIARDGVNDIVNNRAQDFLGAITGTSPPPPPPPASLQDTIAHVVSGFATQVQQSGFLEDVANRIASQGSTGSPQRQGQSFVQIPSDVSDQPGDNPVVDKVSMLMQHGMP
eukprot:jgi/Botrbrau1/12540/Bobra.0169s0081.2